MRPIAEKNLMGMVNVKVKLTNSMDDGLLRRGKIKPEEVRTVEAIAMVDTGAVRSVVPQEILDQLGILIRDTEVVTYADGRDEEVGLTEPIIFELEGRDTPEEAFVLGDEVLIGQTVLEKTDLLVDCNRQRVIPNPAHPDFPVSKLFHRTSRKIDRTK